MNKIKVEYRKAGFVKYSNKFLPKWVSAYWCVWETEKNGVGFRNHDNAMIFKKLCEATN